MNDPITPIEAAQLLLEKVKNSEVLTIAPMETGRGFRGRIDTTEEKLLEIVAKTVLRSAQLRNAMLSMGIFDVLLSEIEEQIDAGLPLSHPGQEAEKLAGRLEMIRRICERYRRFVVREEGT